MQSTVFPLKIAKRLKLVVMLIFLIIDFKIVGYVEKTNFFPEKTIFKGIILTLSNCDMLYNSSLVLSRLDSALVIAAYNIACPQLN